MRLLRVVVLATVVLVAAAELAAPALAESRIEARVSEQLRGAASVDADVGTFPVVTRFLLTSRVRRVSVTLTDVTGRAVPLAEVRYTLEGVELDRSQAMGGEVDVTGMRRGVVTAEITSGDLASVVADAPAVGPDVQFEVHGRQLVVAGVAGPAIPEDVVPCAPQASIEGERLIVTCELEEVPGFLAAQVA